MLTARGLQSRTRRDLVRQRQIDFGGPYRLGGKLGAAAEEVPPLLDVLLRGLEAPLPTPK